MSRIVLLSIALILAILALVALMLPPGVYSAGPATEPPMPFIAPTTAPLHTATPTATPPPMVCKTLDDCPGPPLLLTATPSPTPYIVVCGKEPCEGTPPPMLTGTPTPVPEPAPFRVFLSTLYNCSECMSSWPIWPGDGGQ